MGLVPFGSEISPLRFAAVEMTMNRGEYMRQFVFAKRRVGRLWYERTSFCHSLFAAMFPADFLNDDMPPAALSFRAGLHVDMKGRVHELY